MQTDWNDHNCREKYYELLDKKDNDLTEKEKEFCFEMYLQEEYFAGLD